MIKRAKGVLMGVANPEKCACVSVSVNSGLIKLIKCVKLTALYAKVLARCGKMRFYLGGTWMRTSTKFEFKLIKVEV